MLEAIAKSFLSSGTRLLWAGSAFKPGLANQVSTTTTHPTRNLLCFLNSLESFGYALKHCEIRANMLWAEERVIFYKHIYICIYIYVCMSLYKMYILYKYTYSHIYL